MFTEKRLVVDDRMTDESGRWQVLNNSDSRQLLSFFKRVLLRKYVTLKMGTFSVVYINHIYHHHHWKGLIFSFFFVNFNFALIVFNSFIIWGAILVKTSRERRLLKILRLCDETDENVIGHSVRRCSDFRPSDNVHLMTSYRRWDSDFSFISPFPTSNWHWKIKPNIKCKTPTLCRRPLPNGN